MKLHEIEYLTSMIDDLTTITVVEGNNEFTIDSDWKVAIEAPDGHCYELKKETWTAKDLVEFMMKYPLDDDSCVMMFIYNVPDDFNTLCLVLSEVAVYLSYPHYELEFNAL